MTKIGYKQSAEHKRKRLSQIEGDSNGRWAGGHHPDYYRKKAGAKPNDGTIVHHKNGDRENNKKSNLERLTDGDRVPGRRTTPKHEQITDRTSRKDGTKGKRCPGGYWIPQSKKCALKQSGLPPSAPQSEKKSGKKPGIENSIWPATALAIAGTGVVGLGTAGYLATTAIERARDGDAPSPKIRQRKDGTKGKRCPGGYWIPKSKKCASGQTGSTLKQVENFNHRTKEGGTKSAIENIVWPATALAIAGAGVAGLGIAGYAIASGSGKPSGNAEKKQLIKTIVSSEEKKNPEVTIAPPAEKPVAPTPPPVPKGDRPVAVETENDRSKRGAILRIKKTKKGVMVHIPASGKTHTFTPQSAVQAAIAKAKAIEKGSLINPPGRPPNDWADFKRKNPKGAYRKKKKTTDSTIAIRLAMKQAV